MSGSVSVYQREDGRYFVVSYSRIVAGPLVVNGWVVVLEPDAPDADIGRAVTDGLNRTELDIPELPQDDLRRLLRPLFKLAGVKSYTAYAVGTRSVSVDRDVAGALTITPTENHGRRGGFLYLRDRLTVPANAGHAEVGKAVRKGLDLSRIIAYPKRRPPRVIPNPG